jgi:hypothetical protein
MAVIFLGVGLMYGAPSTIGRLWYCQSAAVCGNLVGGALFIGMVAHLANHWRSPIFTTNELGTGLAHDVESTRHHGEHVGSHSSYPHLNSSIGGGSCLAGASERLGQTTTNNTGHPRSQVDNVENRFYLGNPRSRKLSNNIV